MRATSGCEQPVVAAIARGSVFVTISNNKPPAVLTEQQMNNITRASFQCFHNGTIRNQRVVATTRGCDQPVVVTETVRGMLFFLKSVNVLISTDESS